MGSTLLELCRSTHEELERAQKEIVAELEANPRTYKEGSIQSNKIAKYLEKISVSSKKLSALYEDADGSRKEEISSLGGQGPTVFNTFYDKFRELKDHHRRFPKTVAEHPEEHVYLTDEEALPPFTGEENFGKCLDLHEYYTVYKNLKSGDSTADYVTYVENRFFNFHDNLEQKDKEYKKYLDDLWNYLVDFIRRSQPLFELDIFLKELDQQFEDMWSSFSGWDKPRGTLDDIDDEIPSSETKDKKQTKDDNQPDTIFCEACQKSFKPTVYTAHLKGKKHLRAEEKRSSLNIKTFKEIYHVEYQISETATSLLKEQIANTKTNIEKKQARTLKEWLEEQEEEEEEVVAAVEEEVESEDETQIKTTIDNYPIGWDGKPIPYWLYKLHGLGVEYKCEICGNTSYWGRKAYEKHFQEWRHAHGMRCLGIPNTKHFHDVTKINDALALWEKIKRDSSVQTWKQDNEEEFEDKEGNVFNKKTFEDLKRQGLL